MKEAKEKYYLWGNEDFLSEDELLETCSLVSIPPKRMLDLFIVSDGKKKRPNRKQLNILNQKYVKFMKELIKKKRIRTNILERKITMYKEIDKPELNDIYYYPEQYFHEEEDLIQFCVEEGISPSEMCQNKEEGLLICEPIYGEIELEETLRNKFDIMDEEFEFCKNIANKIQELQDLLSVIVVGYKKYAVPGKHLLEYLDKEYQEQLEIWG